MKRSDRSSATSGDRATAGAKYLLFEWRNGFLHDSELKALTKHVLMVISTHMDVQGNGAHPTTSMLARETSLSERAVVTHIQKAQARGWLKVSLYGANGQGWARHQYEPSWPGDWPCEPEPERTEGTERRSARQPKGTEPHSVPQDDEVLNVMHEGTERDDGKVLNAVQSSSSVSSSGARAPSSSSSSHGLHSLCQTTRTMTTPARPPIPDLLLQELVGKRPSNRPEAFRVDSVARLWRDCRQYDPACTPEAVLEAVNEKIRDAYVAGRDVRSWIGYLLTTVPPTFPRPSDEPADADPPHEPDERVPDEAADPTDDESEESVADGSLTDDCGPDEPVDPEPFDTEEASQSQAPEPTPAAAQREPGLGWQLLRVWLGENPALTDTELSRKFADWGLVVSEDDVRKYRRELGL